jgi:hypothetical protein
MVTVSSRETYERVALPSGDRAVLIYASFASLIAAYLGPWLNEVW